MDTDKQRIITLFINNVKGIDISLQEYNKCHDGKEGHWLESRMGIKHNAKNEPDIYGYEMKNIQLIKFHLVIIAQANTCFQKKEVV